MSLIGIVKQLNFLKQYVVCRARRSQMNKTKNASDSHSESSMEKLQAKTHFII